MNGFKYFLGLLVFCQVAISLEKTPGKRPLQGKLSNQPKIFYEHDGTLLTTTIQVCVLTGALDDPKGMGGLSNILGEMLLRGTKGKSRSQFQGAVERLGATLSVSTSQDKMVFIGKVIKENTIPFMKLIEEALYKPKFLLKEYKLLKRELLADITHAKNSNTRLAGLALRKTVFQGTKLERPVVGGLSTVKKVTLKRVVKSYRDEFHQDNFIFAIASPIPKAKLKKRAVAFWKRFPKGKRRVRTSIAYKMPTVPQLILVHKPKPSTGSIFFGQPGILAKEPLRYVLGAANFSFGGEPLVSRLFKTVRSELGWTYAIGSTYYAMGTLSYQQGLYVISSTPSVEFTSKTIFKLLSMWKKYLKSGLSGDELELAQDSLVNSYPFEFDTARKRLWHKMRSYIYDVPILTPEEHAKTIKDISKSKIRNALAEKHKPNSWVITLVADKDIMKTQLSEAQKEIPVGKRLAISKVLTPDSVIK